MILSILIKWSILARLQQGCALREQVDAWQQLNPEGPDGVKVYPL